MMCKSSKNTTTPPMEKDDDSITSSEPGQQSNNPTEPEKAIKCGSYFPKSTSTRPAYLAARSVSAVLGILLVVLAVIATRVLHRPKWLSPILSPAINAWSASTIDILVVKWKDRRSPRLQRLFYDGAIGIGCSVAAGFLVAFTLADIGGTADGAGADTAAVAWLILFCMFAEV